MSEYALRIAMFTPWRERCGISDYSRHLVTALEAREDIAGVQIIEAPSAQRAGLLHAVRAYASEEAKYRVLGEQMNAEGVSVAHVQHQYFFFGGVAPHKNHARSFLNAARVPLVMTVHEIAEPEASASLLTRRALALTNKANFLHPAIHRLIVHTERDRARLTAVGVSPERIDLIPVGVPPAEPMPSPETAKRELGLDGRRIVMLFGFLSAKKGHQLAIEALGRLPDDVVLLFGGAQHPDDHSEYVPNLRAQLASEGLTDRVTITGYLPETQIPVLMAASDVAVAPFVQSSGSASLAHLFAYGRAIVASDIPPHREIVADEGECLALFRSGDAAELAVTLREVLENAALRERLQSAALRYAERHSFAHMAAQTDRVYRQLAIAG